MPAPDAVDQYGMAAYLCAEDHQPMAATTDEPAVLSCVACGHRTDALGAATLGDGFDVVHRQWGLRADPHVWSAMRDLVAATPTPDSRDATRSAFIEAFGRVVDVDLDGTDDAQVYRQHLNHGGMSGGSVSLDWWRTKGIPLLVDRAWARRPAAGPAPAPVEAAPPPPQRARPVPGPRSRLVGVLVWLVVLAIPAALVGGGGFLLYQRAVGTRAQATVLECDASGVVVRGGAAYRTDCVAQWEIDGRVEVGPIVGGNGRSDVGSTFDVTVRGGTAYHRALALPLLLVGLGAPFLILPVVAIRHRVRRSRHPAA